MAERLIEANGVELCTEAFGDPADSPILLIMGIGASMLWWEDDFCRMLADGGRFVIRYDHRISTSPALPVGRQLPGPTEAFGRFVSTAKADWSDAGSVIDYLVDYTRVLAGSERWFDEAAVRDLVRRDVERARDFAAAQNHDFIPDDHRQRAPLPSIAAPTLVIHGTADPMFPLAHGEAVAEEIPRATLLLLAGAGHGLDRRDWSSAVPAILEHTAQQRIG